MSSTLKVAILQINSSDDIDANKNTVQTLASDNRCKESELLAIPECAMYRYSDSKKPFQSFAINDTIIPWFQALAIEHKKWILVGSFFEKASNKKNYNSSVLINPQGEIHAHYQKMHLFDIYSAHVSIQESHRFNAGREPVITEINGIKAGLSICFDLRFPELYRYYSQQGCSLLFAPSSFTTTTGKKHWKLLCQTRAVENQCYVIAPNQYGTGDARTDTYGHSLIIDPDGQILAEGTADTDDILVAEIDNDYVQRIRKEFPVLQSRVL